MYKALSGGTWDFHAKITEKYQDFSLYLRKKSQRNIKELTMQNYLHYNIVLLYPDLFYSTYFTLSCVKNPMQI